jgi:hypothetical protein
MSDQAALTGSSAGMRLLAQMTLFNRGDFDRLGTFIAESYTPAALADEPPAAALERLRDLRASAGPLRVYQVIASDPHRLIALAQSRLSGALFYMDIAVEDDYPHRITAFTHYPLPAQE